MACDQLAVFTTVADAAQADLLARTAVEQRLAACVQAEPVRSTYRWHGAVEVDDEVRLMFKTTRARYPALAALLQSLHPYELPALFALAVDDASVPYARWVEASVAPAAEGPTATD